MMHPTTYEYLKPTDEQIERMARVRAAGKAYNGVLDAEVPPAAWRFAKFLSATRYPGS
jgi:hypothetical protein